MKVAITGDTHGSPFRLSKESSPHLYTEEISYAVILGDYGLVWYGEETKHESYIRKWLNNRPFKTIVILGNHENFERIYNLPLEYAEDIDAMVYKHDTNIYIIPHGTVITLNGKKCFCFGGGLSIDKPFRKDRVSWWAEEMPSTADYDRGLTALANHGNKVDFIFTHTCSNNAKYWLLHGKDIFPGEEPLNAYFEFIENNISYQHWYFGHFHTTEDIDDKTHALYEDIIIIEV